MVHLYFLVQDIVSLYKSVFITVWTFKFRILMRATDEYDMSIQSNKTIIKESFNPIRSQNHSINNISALNHKPPP